MGVADLYRDRASLGHIPVLKGQTLIETPYRLQADANTVGLWQFDEKMGTTLLDKAPTPHAITLDGPTWTTGGPWGSALSFDGSNDYGRLSEHLLHGETNCTIEIVCRSSVASYGGGDMSLYLESDSGGVYWVFQRSDNKLVLAWYTSGGWYVLFSDNDIASWTDWKYIAATNANKTGTLYANGVSVGTSNAAALCNKTGFEGTYICRNFATGTTWGTFEIAAIRLSTVARSTAEILTNAKLMGFA